MRMGRGIVFDLDCFIANCKSAMGAGGAQKAIRELMHEAVSDPGQVIRVLGEPKKAVNDLLYRTDTLTIINLTWGPRMTAMPHNHHMWAVIGMYAGREDNIFWRTLPDDARWPLEAAGASALMPGDVCPLGKDIIHSVTNPLCKLTSAIHIYGGDFVTQQREQWEEETLRMRPYDQAGARRKFEEANHLMELAAAA
jgi:predicted metal-dependent enzyme (double-stranded beta helix superfamily)